MTFEILGTTAWIFLARVVDVSLGTFRTVAVVRGRRGLAFAFGFFEVLIWVIVVSRVIDDLSHPAFMVAFALGFATGTTVGITAEGWFAMGEQAVRIFTQRGHVLVAKLRDGGFQVTEFSGTGRDGPVSLLFVQIPRKHTKAVLGLAREHDPTCFLTVDDVRLASTGVAADPRSPSHDHLT